MSYFKRGGLHFIRIGRFGFTWYWAKPKKWQDDYLGYYGDR